MKQPKRLPKLKQETKLERVVRYWLNSRAADYENGWRGAYRDLERGGCASGLVGKLIYYADTMKFYKRHQGEINELLTEKLKENGGSVADLFREAWDVDDPLVMSDTNQNLLAWFGFEETAWKIANANGYDDVD